MRRIERGIVIRDKILRYAKTWNFGIKSGCSLATTSQIGWRALIWSGGEYGSSEFSPDERRDLFVDACSRHLLPHTVDLWVDDLGKVMSIRRGDGQCTLITYIRGTWETRYFHLSPPKSPSSPYYVKF